MSHITRRGILTGALASLLSGPAHATTEVFTLSPGRHTLTGGPTEDLHVFVPPLNRFTQLFASGYRNIIVEGTGGALRKRHNSNLIARNGAVVNGGGLLLSLQTGRTAIRPRIVIRNLTVDTSDCAWGDLFQVGGAAPPGKWASWPDLFIDNVHVWPGVLGWGEYLGGTAGPDVSHSDLVKFDRGGVRDVYVSNCVFIWGFQILFLVPSFATNYVDYAGGRSGQVYIRDTTITPVNQLPRFPQLTGLPELNSVAAMYIRVNGRPQHKFWHIGPNVRLKSLAGSYRHLVRPVDAAHINGGIMTLEPPFGRGHVLLG